MTPAQWIIVLAEKDIIISERTLREKVVDDTKVKELSQSGMGATAIAKELGIGRATVYKSLRS